MRSKMNVFIGLVLVSSILVKSNIIRPLDCRENFLPGFGLCKSYGSVGCPAEAFLDTCDIQENCISCCNGLTGQNCDIDINDCLSNPCNNGENCTDQRGSYTCSCPTGYTGTNCETDIDDCFPNPCYNGATCIDQLGSYNCSCRPGYTGKHCETDINDCLPNPCYNGATCIDQLGSYNCSCRPGYTGKHCETDINDCLPNPCYNGATCIDQLGSYNCSCRPGYTGKHCETDINDCLPNPCYNGANCTDQPGSYNCSCRPGYTGKHCETDECACNPCQHNGKCVNLLGKYECFCKNGYTGNRCQKAPKVRIKPAIILKTVISVLEGLRLLPIPCYAEGIPTPTTTWGSATNKLPSNARQIAHYLVFDNITMADDGFYMCRASNEVGEDIQVVHVMVKARPSRQHFAPSISAPAVVQAYYYTPVNLTCTVTGYPVPNVTWTYKHQQNAVMAFGNTLHILQATNVTEGVYTCTAINDVGTSKADVTLKVVHGVPRITIPPKSSLNHAGIDGNFTCQADGVPEPTITWTFQPFGQAGNTLGVRHGSKITITNMQQSGILTCVATNEFGTERAQANIIISKGGGSVIG